MQSQDNDVLLCIAQVAGGDSTIQVLPLRDQQQAVEAVLEDARARPTRGAVCLLDGQIRAIASLQVDHDAPSD